MIRLLIILLILVIQSDAKTELSTQSDFNSFFKTKQPKVLVFTTGVDSNGKKTPITLGESISPKALADLKIETVTFPQGVGSISVYYQTNLQHKSFTPLGCGFSDIDNSLQKILLYTEPTDFRTWLVKSISSYTSPIYRKN